MTKTDWRKLARRFPRHTLVGDPAAYADVFAAIDEAAERARRVEPSPDEMEVLAVVRRDGDEEGPDEPLFIWRVPVVPVRCANTVRLCIGLLQYSHWPVVRTAEGGSLPHVDTLLRRRLRPTLDEAIDLASLLVVPVYGSGREDYLGPSAPILNLIEDNFRPPIPEPLANVLREAKRRLTSSETITSATRGGGTGGRRPNGSTSGSGGSTVYKAVRFLRRPRVG